MDLLAVQEQTELTKCEAVIERGLQTFVDVGNALLRIRDGRLYRIDYGTFEEYCLSRWNMSRSYAHRNIEAAKVAGNLLPQGNIPTTEKHARPLTKLEPEQQREAWQTAIETAPNGKVTARHVESVVAAYQPPPLEKTEQQNGMAVHYSSETDLWATPQDLFDVLDAEFGFALDVCATHQNAKCENYFTEEDDGLAQAWNQAFWMNPPYGSEIGQWVDKARESAAQGVTGVCLVPARTDTRWWWDNVQSGEVRFLRGRLKFGDSMNSAPFPSAVVVFRAGLPLGHRRMYCWEWR